MSKDKSKSDKGKKEYEMPHKGKMPHRGKPMKGGKGK